MNIEICTRTDFDEILKEQTEFWGADRALSVHHPMFIEEFGETAFVLRDSNEIMAYLFGFFARDDSYFYIHLVAVREHMRSKGLAAKLYLHVEQVCKQRNVNMVKAITPPQNTASLSFHQALGFEATGTV
jgi:GNAT superfamily N-acetyltransferase